MKVWSQSQFIFRHRISFFYHRMVPPSCVCWFIIPLNYSYISPISPNVIVYNYPWVTNCLPQQLRVVQQPPQGDQALPGNAHFHDDYSGRWGYTLLWRSKSSLCMNNMGFLGLSQRDGRKRGWPPAFEIPTLSWSVQGEVGWCWFFNLWIR